MPSKQRAGARAGKARLPRSKSAHTSVIPPDATPEERTLVQLLSRIGQALELAGVAPTSRSTARKAGPDKSPSRPKHPLRKSRSRREPARFAPASESSSPAHVSRCTVCCHQLRSYIEEDFVHWVSPYTIAQDYNVPVRTIYRHAHAMNLFALRDRKVRFALGNIIERVGRTAMTSDCILRAIQAFTKVNDEGRWVEPPKRLILSAAPGAIADAENSAAVATSVAVAIGAPPAQLETQVSPAPELLPAGVSNLSLPASNP
jgi:hypothetical protein